MSRPSTLPLADSSPLRPKAPPLRVVQEPGKNAFLTWEESRQTLAPLPVLPPPEAPAMPATKERRNDRSLPSLVPLDPVMFAHANQPWAVRGVVDFLKLFLPELSLTMAAVLGSGVLTARLAQRLVSTNEAIWIIAAYGAVSLVDLGGFYLSAKAQPYPVNKTKAQRRLLLAAGLLLSHIVAYSLLKTLK